MAGLVGHVGADQRVDRGGPDHVAGNHEAGAAQRDGRRARDRPEDHDEGEQRDHRREQVERQRQRAGGERIQVVGDPLVGVVGQPVALDAVEGAVAEPVVERLGGDPLPPAETQQLSQVAAVDGDDDEGERIAGEDHQQVRHLGGVLLLQRVVEGAVPGIEPDVDPDHREIHRDDRDQQRPGQLPFRGHPVGLDQAPRGDAGVVGRRVVRGAGGGGRGRHGFPAFGGRDAGLSKRCASQAAHPNKIVPVGDSLPRIVRRLA